jgi:arylsulfatase A-like enzyme
MDETPSLREIQEQEAAQREMAQMEDQQQQRQQQQQQAQKANEVAWTGGRGTKKPTLAEIQAEELKQQQKRQKEMQHQHKQQLKAQREQLSRFSSPWAGAAQVVRIPFPSIPSRKGHGDGGTHHPPLNLCVCRRQNDRPPRAALSR